MTLWPSLRAATGWRGRGFDFLIGGLAVFGHAPFHFWGLTLLCFAIFMSRLDNARARGKGGFGSGFLFGLGYFLCGTFWIGSAFIVRGPEFIPAMPPMILGLATVLALFWGLGGWIYNRLSGERASRWIGLAAILTLTEFARGHVLGGFPWNLPGYIFESGGQFSQMAAYAGIYGLSFFVLLVSAGLARILTDGWGNFTAILCATLLAFGFGWGHYRLSGASTDFVDDVKIRIVQVPFSQKDKFDADSSIAIVNDFLRLSITPDVSDITHLVWPEGAVVGMALENRPLLRAMGQLLSSETQTPPYWLLNSLRYEIEPVSNGPPRELYYNTSAVIAFDAQGTPAVQNINDKRRLVPFGEFFPGGRWVEELGSKTLSTSLASITPAPQKDLAKFPGAPLLSPQICYEIAFSRLTPRPENGQRAKWILNQTNDAWFGKSIGPAQHANIAAYRAIEEGVPVIRAASNGISGVIDPYGRYLDKLEAHDRGVLDIFLPEALPHSHLTRRHNGLLFLIILLISVIALIDSRRQAPGNKQTPR